MNCHNKKTFQEVKAQLHMARKEEPVNTEIALSALESDKYTVQKDVPLPPSFTCLRFTFTLRYLLA